MIPVLASLALNSSSGLLPPDYGYSARRFTERDFPGKFAYKIFL
jgi:hypothetical protein